MTRIGSFVSSLVQALDSPNRSSCWNISEVWRLIRLKASRIERANDVTSDSAIEVWIGHRSVGLTLVRTSLTYHSID